MNIKWTLEDHIDDWIKARFKELGLKNRVDFGVKSDMSDYLKEALKGSAKTENSIGSGIPDFTIEKYNIPVIIENKLSVKNHVNCNASGLKMDISSIRKYAVNGALYYAKNMILSHKYNEVVAIGISGDEPKNIKTTVYYVYSAKALPKLMEGYKTLNFLQNEVSFKEFYTDATITEQEKQAILISTRKDILKYSKALNKLMERLSISVEQRVGYVSGMLLAMQSIISNNGDIIDLGLKPDDLRGIQTDSKRDSITIINHLAGYLEQKKIPDDKKKIMLESFRSSIALDPDRDAIIELDKTVSSFLKENASKTKQIFTFIYKYIYEEIDMHFGALDIMAEMYSTFLKYALSDGASLGKVLTPPYITALMTKLIDIDMDSHVMDLATGSAAFLVAAMSDMIDDANANYGRKTKKAADKIMEILSKQLLGIEEDAKMYTLAATNMIIRGDGSSQIRKANSFAENASELKKFGADRFLLNPPFSYDENGMPFFELGLNLMKKGGKAAIIIQDSAGSGKAEITNQRILKNHRMLASIKMPFDLFQPNATVQTSIYIFEAGNPHDFRHDIVKFIDFRCDGFKRTDAGRIYEDNYPIERYSDLYLIYKLGKNADKDSRFHNELWNLNEVYIEGLISPCGTDWNFEKHQEFLLSPNYDKFVQNAISYLEWKAQDASSTNRKELPKLSSSDKLIIKRFIEDEIEMKEFRIGDFFEIENISGINKSDLTKYDDTDIVYDYITRTSKNRGILQSTGFVFKQPVNEAGSYSLGGMQLDFFYREKAWYAGQFVKKIIPKHGKTDKNIALFFEVFFNSLNPLLKTVLFGDLDELFLNRKLSLPTIDNYPDWNYISRFYETIKKVAVLEKKNELENIINRMINSM